MTLLGALITLAACGQSDSGSSAPAPQSPAADEGQEGVASSADAQTEAGADSSAGGGATAEPLSPEEFARLANVVCVEATQAIDALAPPGSLEELALRVPELQDIAQRELDGLRALGQPLDPGERLDPTYFSLLEQQLSLLQNLRDAAAIGDVVTARDVLGEAAVLNQRAAQIATEYGLDQCTDLTDVDDLSAVAPSEPLTPEAAFIAAADMVCSDSRDLVDSLREPRTVEESAEILNDVIDISTEELLLLTALEPPEQLAARFAELLALRQEQIGTLARLGDALALDDRDASSEALLESSRLNGQTDLIERELGFLVCGIEVVEEVPNQVRTPAPQTPAEEPS